MHRARIVGGPALNSNLKMSSVGCSQGSVYTKTSNIRSQKCCIPDFILGLLHSFLGRDYKTFSVLQTVCPILSSDLLRTTSVGVSLHFNAVSPPAKPNQTKQKQPELSWMNDVKVTPVRLIQSAVERVTVPGITAIPVSFLTTK